MQESLLSHVKLLVASPFLYSGFFISFYLLYFVSFFSVTLLLHSRRLAEPTATGLNRILKDTCSNLLFEISKWRNTVRRHEVVTVDRYCTLFATEDGNRSRHFGDPVDHC